MQSPSPNRNNSSSQFSQLTKEQIMSSQAIQVFNRMTNPIEAIDKMGEWIAKSGFARCDKVEQGKVIALACMCKQQDPFELLQTYDIVDGGLRKKALAVLAEFRKNHKGKHRWLATGEDGKAATIELTHDGQTIQYTFTIEQAKSQGLLRAGSNWVKSVGNMLRARAITNGVAMLCPEITAGYTEENDEAAVVMTEPKPLLAVVETPAKTVTQSAAVEVNVEVVKDEPQESKAVELTIREKLIDQAQEVIGADNSAAAIAWMTEKKWITDGKLSTLSEERARKIINNPQGFIQAITPVAKTA